MKKIISITMALLCILSNSVTKGYEIKPTANGGKKVVCKYSDLPWLIKQYETTIQNTKKSGNFKTNAAYLTSEIVTPLGVGSSFSGAWIAGCETTKPKINKGVVVSGAGLTVAGILALILAPMCAYNVANKESKKLAHLETEKIVIEKTKLSIDLNISSGLCTKSQAENSFCYTLFIDEEGFVYKKSRTGGCLVAESVNLGENNCPIPKYKLDLAKESDSGSNDTH